MWMQTLPVEPLKWNKLTFPASAQIWTMPARTIRPGNPGKLQFHLKGFLFLILNPKNIHIWPNIQFCCSGVQGGSEWFGQIPANHMSSFLTKGDQSGFSWKVPGLLDRRAGHTCQISKRHRSHQFSTPPYH